MISRRLNFIALAVSVIAGAGLVLAWHQAAEWQAQRDQLTVQKAALEEDGGLVRHERDYASNRAARLAEEAAFGLRNPSELEDLRNLVPQMRKQVADLLATNAALARETGLPAFASPLEQGQRVQLLKNRLAAQPDAAIPEFKFLTPEDWNQAVDYPLEKETDYRRALASLRSSAEARFMTNLHEALNKYLNDGHTYMPDALTDLRPYFDVPPDEAILQRYRVVGPDAVPTMGLGGDKRVVTKEAVDQDYDQLWVMGTVGISSISFADNQRAVADAPMGRLLLPVFMAYMADQKTDAPPTPEALLPYLKTPEQKAAFQVLLQRAEAATNQTMRDRLPRH